MPSFDTLQQEADNRNLIRKIKKAVAFINKGDAELPATLFEAGGTLVDLKAAGWKPLGMVTPDGYEFGREINKNDVSALGYASAVRSDVESVARSVKVTLLEHGRRHIAELEYGADYSAVKQDKTTGEIVFAEPDLPVDAEWKLIVLGSDGPADNNWIFGRGYGSVKLSASGSEKWGSADPIQKELTFDVFTDKAVGTPVRHYVGGTGAIKAKAELGYTQSA